LAELQAFHKQRETKSEATIQQQTKLIDYLQKRIEDANKKKKVCIIIDSIRFLYQIFSAVYGFHTILVQPCSTSIFCWCPSSSSVQ
jgi:hypothetical protein